jgi:F-type H+-transporting ATPase subunit b
MYFLGLAENPIQLVPDGTILLHIALILIMIGVLNATLFKPINKILKDRDKRTRGRSGEASDILLKVDERLTHYENTLREARTQGYHLLEQTRAEAMNARQAKLDLVREEVNGLIRGQKDAIQKQAEDARANLGKEARTLAARISSQILRRPVKG